jgi:acylphosphatase
MRCCRVTVYGRVQGVWYRESCRREAVSAGVAGWVRNNADGTVEALLEGEAPAVERVLAWMRRGPPGAVVTDSTVTPGPPTGARTFVVK